MQALHFGYLRIANIKIFLVTALHNAGLKKTFTFKDVKGNRRPNWKYSNRNLLLA